MTVSASASSLSSAVRSPLAPRGPLGVDVLGDHPQDAGPHPRGGLLVPQIEFLGVALEKRHLGEMELVLQVLLAPQLDGSLPEGSVAEHEPRSERLAVAHRPGGPRSRGDHPRGRRLHERWKRVRFVDVRDAARGPTAELASLIHICPEGAERNLVFVVHTGQVNSK